MTKNNLYIFLIGLLISFVVPFEILAIGQVTKPISIDNALRGQEFGTQLMLVNSEEKSMGVELIAEGDIKDWVTFLAEDLGNVNITTLAPKEQKNVNVKFSIPADTPNGTYAGYLSILEIIPEKENEEGATANIRQKISREATIVVTDEEDINIAVSIIPESYDIEEGETFNFRVVYTNEGNIAVKPSVEVKIKQIDNIISNMILPYPEDQDGVKPLETKEIDMIRIPVIGANEGKVRAEIVVKEGDSVIKEQTIRFSLGEEVIEEEEKEIIKEENKQAFASSVNGFFDSPKNIFGLLLILIVLVTIILKIGGPNLKKT